ncbi:MAG: hypothetical protein ACP5OG_03585 [Candidatus Nanoarchaeia archaeon]
MKIKKSISFYPKTKIGCISFYGAFATFLLLVLKTNNLLIPFPAMILTGVLCLFGISSIASIIKFKDYSILLVICSLIGIFFILFSLGEIFYPH